MIWTTAHVTTDGTLPSLINTVHMPKLFTTGYKLLMILGTEQI